MPDIDETQLTKRQRRELRKEEWKHQQSSSDRQKTMTRVGFWTLIVVIIAGSVYLLSKNDNTNNTPLVIPEINTVTEIDHVKGDKNAKLTLVEYSDFQCPACARYFSAVDQVGKDLGQQVKIVYRNFPLTQIHKNANMAARAAESAGLQGKFWEMHDMLFNKQTEWSNEGDVKKVFIEYANTLGLDGVKFENDLESDAVKNKIDGDIASAVRAGVNSTPTFYLDGVKISPAPTFAGFNEIIQNELSTKQ